MTSRIADVAFREGIRGEPLESVESSVLSAVNNQVQVLVSQRDEAKQAAIAAVSQLSTVAEELKAVAKRYDQLYVTVSTQAEAEYRGRAINWIRTGMGVVSFLFFWWAVSALLAPFMQVADSQVDRVRIVFALFCTAGTVLLLLLLIRWYFRRDTEPFDLPEPGKEGYWGGMVFVLLLAGYLAVSPSAGWLFVLLALTSLGVTLLSWATVEFRQTDAVGEHLREHRDLVRALQVERERVAERLMRYSRQVTTLDDRSSQLDHEIREIQKQQAVLKLQIAESHHFGRMVGEASREEG
jgi:hypothetical protein